MALASRYRYYIEILQAANTRDENRQPVKAYTHFKNKKAGVKFTGGSEFEQNDKTRSRQTVEFKVRFDEDLKETMAVKYENRQYNITAIIPMRQLGEMVLKAEIIE